MHTPLQQPPPTPFQSTKINSFIRTFSSMFPTEEEDVWRLLLKASLFNAQVAIYLLNDEKEETSCTTTLLSKAWVYSECSQLQGKAKRYVSSTAMQKTLLFSRTQQLSKTPSGDSCLVAAVYKHFPHLLTPPSNQAQKDNANHLSDPRALLLE